jgi:hypothetical protein
MHCAVRQATFASQSGALISTWAARSTPAATSARSTAAMPGDAATWRPLPQGPGGRAQILKAAPFRYAAAIAACRFRCCALRAGARSRQHIDAHLDWRNDVERRARRLFEPDPPRSEEHWEIFHRHRL